MLVICQFITYNAKHYEKNFIYTGFYPNYLLPLCQ